MLDARVKGIGWHFSIEEGCGYTSLLSRIEGAFANAFAPLAASPQYLHLPKDEQIDNDGQLANPTALLESALAQLNQRVLLDDEENCSDTLRSLLV